MLGDVLVPIIQHAALGEFTVWMSGVSRAAGKVKPSPGETSWNMAPAWSQVGRGGFLEEVDY